MPAAVQDFRNYSYSNDRILACGKYLGKNTYWKIFVIENLIRIIIHSILSIQYHKGSEWWDDLAGDAKKSYERNKQRYLNQEAQLYSTPGLHPLYFVDIKDLNEIIRANKPLFVTVLSEKIIDNMLVKIEDIRIPRNIVAHMNFPNKTDRDRINVFYTDLQKIIELVSSKTQEILIP